MQNLKSMGTMVTEMHVFNQSEKKNNLRKCLLWIVCHIFIGVNFYGALHHDVNRY